jgi:hypothetical protein
MFHQMSANVLKSQCFQCFHITSASAGAGLVVIGGARDSMKRSLNQEDSINL